MDNTNMLSWTDYTIFLLVFWNFEGFKFDLEINFNNLIFFSATAVNCLCFNIICDWEYLKMYLQYRYWKNNLPKYISLYISNLFFIYLKALLKLLIKRLLVYELLLTTMNFDWF